MRSNTLRHPATEIPPQPIHPVPCRSKVICIHCYRMLGMAASARTETRLRHDHKCAEARLALQPAAPPPYN